MLISVFKKTVISIKLMKVPYERRIAGRTK